MTPTSEAKIRDLVWQYPELEGQPFLLLDAGVEIGRLAFHEEPAASIGELRGQRWTFRYSTKLQPRVTVHRDDSQKLVAEYVPCLTGGGVVSFDSGVCYRWRKASVWGDKWCFCHQEQKSSVCLSQDTGPLTQGGKVSVCCGAADLPETPVLLLLAWFLRILDFEMLVEGIFRVG
ncbi:MAG: hypothetical protein ABSH44_12595 [Bryobacteraceae bacterium]|jgi:hypothetical protein